MKSINEKLGHFREVRMIMKGLKLHQKRDSRQGFGTIPGVRGTDTQHNSCSISEDLSHERWKR